MQRAPLIVNRRLKRRAKLDRNPIGSAGLGCSLLVSLVVVSFIISGALIYTQLTSALPSPLTLPVLVEPPNGILLQPTRLYDRSGQHLILNLENPAAKDHHYLHVDVSSAGNTALSSAPPATSGSFSNTEIFSPILVKATLALADPTFWSNPGFVLSEWNNPAPATIAERLVSTLLLENEKPGILHNLRLRLLAAQVTARFGRVKILEWYLNTAQYGPLVFGADAAARVYFHKSASEVSLIEASALAAIAEAPQLNPFDAPQITIEKRQQVVHSMLSLGWISSTEAEQTSQAKLDLAQAQKPDPELAPAFTKLALQQLSDQFGKERLERGGLNIRTSLDYDLQLQVNCAVKAQLQKINQPANGTVLQSEDECPAARLLPTLPVTDQSPTSTLTAEVIVYDPQSGQILAQSGDPGLSSLHPIGSLLTPFIYLTAFTRGLSPASLVWDIPSSSPTSNASTGELPLNRPTGEPYHGPVRIRTAFANDYLTPAAELLSQVGPENVALTSQQLGVAGLDTGSMENFIQADPIFQDGNVSILEMAGAYGVIANQGILAGLARSVGSGQTGESSVQPMTVLSVETSHGDLLESCITPATNCTTQAIPVLSPQLAYLMTDVLSDETARWPAYGHPNPLEIGRPAGAKIGSTSNGASAWTLGFTPQLLVGVWVGPKEDSSPTQPANPSVTGASAAIWHAILQYSSRNLPPDDWTAPAGIQTVQVCDPSGMLPTTTCPTVVNEVFLSGNEPTQPDNLYQVFHVNRETGRLATVFTPPQLIEDQVYLVVPPEAAEWARSANLPIPPDNYDVIYSPVTSPNAVIKTPAMFATASGRITIQGTADGDDFSFYRIQVGKGLNPTQWEQIGKDNPDPVDNATLGQWDVSGLDGLYALQLLVVHKDQRVDTNIVQLTLDSQAPQVKILHPVDGQTIHSRDTSVVLQASANDNLALSKVEFYLDNQLVGILYQAPFTLSWQVKPGSHKFIAKAYDLANNTGQDGITFKAGN